MLKKQRKLPTYNDGVVSIYREKDKKSTFRVNPESLDDLDFVVKLSFATQSMREQDFTAAEQRGINVSAKIKTHLAPGVSVGCKALIGTLIYDVKYVDPTRTEIYLFLEGGTPFGNP